MRLFIAEKPSLARAIVAALPEPRRERGNYIECGAGDVVAWCRGHILELADADVYSNDYKTWRLDHLPIAPSEWQLVVTTPELLKRIKTLLPRASRVVHAGDPDREGQLLVDEVLDYLGYKGPVDRVCINDTNLVAVRKALGALEPNQKYRPLSQAAQARQRADWLYGINLTRLYTIQGRAGGHDGVLSVGRVQTPLLGLVVRRDLEIDAFQPCPYFTIRAALSTADGPVTATWVPGADAAAALDQAGRLIDRNFAARVQSRTNGHAGVVAACDRQERSEPPPLPYSLSVLQVEASRRLGLTPKAILECCQSLYETHRLTTYPRSDCSYLPEGHFADAAGILAAVASNRPELAGLAAQADPTRRSRAWNDSKVTAHHALIPTSASRPAASLSNDERAIYDLIARRYIAQFYPSHQFHQTTLEVLIADQRFRAVGRVPIAPGWKALLGEDPAQAPPSPTDSDNTDAAASLPRLHSGDPVSARDVTILDRKTTPPKRFTEATLLEAMTAIARFVTNPDIKKVLHDTDGIGTPATQASIIQTLFDRGYVEKQNFHVVSTAIGRTLIAILPTSATTPDMTALWELAMKRIESGAMPLPTFLSEVIRHIHQLVVRGRVHGALKMPGARACPAPGCAGVLRRRRGVRGSFWSCSRFPDCKYVSQDTLPGPADHSGAPRAQGPHFAKDPHMKVGMRGGASSVIRRHHRET